MEATPGPAPGCHRMMTLPSSLELELKVRVQSRWYNHGEGAYYVLLVENGF